ncbi:hypothetical protein IE81DRAFT_99316 [Ceraceosorus guamensis]|uniref:Uncharacterized protein n=1 Tax=Ceraceosorus guamensis TaxID=1522189 RepID=A0A316VZU3_9BASI|nr:hypothetical protein IE81DRAFT_99316 [Ceraceosorus guamensis]PWN43187.1 hypothetical protein IE81DRAFT_99316 [Ceraceosorus guamensis]
MTTALVAYLNGWVEFFYSIVVVLDSIWCKVLAKLTKASRRRIHVSLVPRIAASSQPRDRQAIRGPRPASFWEPRSEDGSGNQDEDLHHCVSLHSPFKD